jgi:threonine/homoserine/homoserine lactone efflux protein
MRRLFGVSLKEPSMDIAHVIALIIFLFPLAYSPGPGNAFFASVGASRGMRGAMPSLIGYHVATFIVTMLIGLGLEVTILTEPRLMLVLSLLGGAYVIWIGLQFLQAARAEPKVAEGPVVVRDKVGFIDGAVVLLLNPKAYVIIGLLFTQFLVSGDDRFGEVFMISTIFTLNNLVAFIVWTLAGVAIAALLRGDAAHRNLNLGFGFGLIAVGIWMIWPAMR